MTKKLIHLEGLIILITTIYFYSMSGFNWWIFFVLLLSPDISMLSYLINNRIGAEIYNLFHTYTISIPIIVLGVFLKHDFSLMIGLIWTAHIGMDRFLGYGLKYKTSFQDTHMQRL